MRILLICACVLACAFLQVGATKNLKAEVKKAISLRPEEELEACFSEVGISQETVIKEEEIMRGDHLKPENQDRKEKTGLFVECCMKKIEILEGSTIMENRIHTYVTLAMQGDPMEATAHRIVHDCTAEAKDLTHDGEKGWKMLECVCKALHNIEDHEDH